MKLRTIEEAKKVFEGMDYKYTDPILLNNHDPAAYMINKFPFKTWIWDGSSPKSRMEVWRICLPWPEEIRPKELEIRGNKIFLKHSSPPKDTLDIINLPLHYSTSRMTWEFDYCLARGEYGGPEFDTEIILNNPDSLGKVLMKLRKWKIKHGKYYLLDFYDYVGRNEIQISATEVRIKIRLTKRNYFIFRKFLLDLKDIGISVFYDYDEIRKINRNHRVGIYI